ncbi:MAG: 3-hydroxyacyl-ACP dehydratase FabZ [Bdellovibrionales bacterium]
MGRYQKEPPWEIDHILELLPHRYPFVLVDRVVKINQQGTDDNRENSEIFAIKNVTFNENFFPGHFPTRPIMPGVLIVEAMAQACALMSCRPLPPEAKRWDFYIVGVNDAKFRRPVVPGDQIELYGKIIRDKKSMVIFNAEARVEGQVAAQAQIMAKMVAIT